MSRTNIATRRNLLKGLGLVGVGAALPNFLVRTAAAAPQVAPAERVVVALLLSGGHDGLASVPPYGLPEYAKHRSATRIGDDEVIKLDDKVGLHPKMAGFKELLNEGAFATVLGTGYPGFNYSHFIARDIWMAADREGRKSGRGGWLGRYCDYALKDLGDPLVSVAVGGRDPLTLRGEQYPGVSLDRPETFRLMAVQGAAERELYMKLNKLGQSDVADNLQFVTRTSLTANASSEQIRDLAEKYVPKVEYPSTGLGKNLRLIAGMIVGGMRTHIYHTEQGGYDTHSNQRLRHDQLTGELNDALLAFQRDLAAHKVSDRVLTFTYSEFGRRVQENKSNGTDHGSAQPMFLLGPGVKPGIHGRQPGLADEDLDRGNLKMTVDFRCVYAAILEKWLGVESKPVIGEKFDCLDCLT